MPVHDEGFALLKAVLSRATPDTTAFTSLFLHLCTVLNQVLARIERELGEQVVAVMASGEWARCGIDLRNLPYDAVVLALLLHGAERPFDLYQRVAKTVFTELEDGDILIQFRLMTRPEWQHALDIAGPKERGTALGIELWHRPGSEWGLKIEPSNEES